MSQPPTALKSSAATSSDGSCVSRPSSEAPIWELVLAPPASAP